MHNEVVQQMLMSLKNTQKDDVEKLASLKRDMIALDEKIRYRAEAIELLTKPGHVL